MNTDVVEILVFVNQHVVNAAVERAIVLRDNGGSTIGEIWDGPNHFAHRETPAKMRTYLELVGFDQNDVENVHVH